MAKVYVEGRAFSENRLFNFVEDIGANRATALGILLILWHDSQASRVIEASRDEILHFLPRPYNKPEILDALVRNKYLSKSGADRFVVHGNKKHITILNEIELKRSAAGKLGGKRSGEVRRENLLHPKTNENNDIEANTKQNEANESNSKQEASKRSNVEPLIRSDQIRSDQVSNTRVPEVAIIASEEIEHELAFPKPTNPRKPPDLVKLWNQNCQPEFRPVGHIAGTWLKNWRDRWSEHPDRQFWVDLIKKARESPYLRGEVNGFRMTLGWLLQDPNAEEILGGRFDGKEGDGDHNPTAGITHKVSLWETKNETR